MISIRCVKQVCERYTEVENYEEAIKSKDRYVLHHRREVQNGVQIWSMKELKEIGQYYNLEPEELIFMKLSEHSSLHRNAFDPKRKCLCKVMTDEQKKKLSSRKLGNIPWNKGVTGKVKWSDEQRKKFEEYTNTDKFKSKYNETRNDKIRQSRLGMKRKYLPDGSYIMIRDKE